MPEAAWLRPESGSRLQEPCNRTITIRGCGGQVPAGGTGDHPVELFVGNAGTAARFLTAFVALGQGVYRLHGVPRMHERPQASLFDALRQLGYRVDSSTNRLPALVHGGGRRAGSCSVSVAESSQFASALLLCGEVGGWQVQVTGENEEESPYVLMTARVLETFPRLGGLFSIEPDASSGSYFWAAGSLEPQTSPEQSATNRQSRVDGQTSRPHVRVAQWPISGLQIDERFPEVLAKIHGTGSPGERRISRRSDLGDSIMTAIVLAPLAKEPTEFTDLGRLRLQECERVLALKTELAKCGANLLETGDTLAVQPFERLHGAEIDTYQDHRMAMSFAILGLKVPGIKIKNPGCVKKTFPNFFQKLAAPPPQGLGVTIREVASGRKVPLEGLFAE